MNALLARLSGLSLLLLAWWGSHPAPLLAFTAPGVRLGVLRSGDRPETWDGIQRRLDASGQPYRVLNWENLRQPSDFGDSNVVFLPNQTRLSRRQADLLVTWAQRGGHLIASGAIATDSSRRVQRELDNVLGARWSLTLPDTPSLQLLEVACDRDPSREGTWGVSRDDRLVLPPNDPCPDRPWMPRQHTRPERPAGLLALTDPRSQPAANWRISGTAAAVVVAPNATYFGWTWGSGGDSTLDFDVAWLQGALSRLASSEATRPSAVDPSVENPTIAIQPQPIEPVAISPSDRPAIEPLLDPSSLPSATTTPSRPAVPAAVPARPPVVRGNPHPAAPVAETAPRATASELSDPASQTAPPGLSVEPGDAPLDRTLALRMERELRQLLGRVESAVLAAQSRGRAGELANRSLASGLDAGVEGAAIDLAPLEFAETVLRQFPGWVEAEEHRQARSQWLEARSQLWQSYPNDRPRDTAPEVRAIWLDRGTIVRAGSKAELAPLFDRLAEAGINTVFFETLNAGYPIYPSQVAPEQNPLTQGWDPLQAAIELARERGMELHAWIWTFAVGNQRHNALLGQPSSFLGPVLAANPDWANRDDLGVIRHAGSRKTFLDPANQEARWYLLRLVDEIATNYDIDGLQLDYIRYPFQDPSAERTYGYGTAGRRRFQELTGVDPMEISPRQVELWQRWTDFRVEQVTSFVQEVDRHLEQRDPNLVLSVAVFPQSTHDRIHKIQQHWETWIENGSVDMVVPMTYARDTNRLGQIVMPLLADVPEGALLVPSVKLHDLPEIEAIDQMQLLRDSSAHGYALFAAEMLGDELQGILRLTQPNEDSAPVPQQQPFKAAQARYGALQAEWQTALALNRLWVGGTALADWQAGDRRLAEALDRLVQEPTAANLSIARDRLRSFQGEFSDWLRLHRLSNRERVLTWERRLQAIEGLLIYGDRRLE